MLAALGAAGCTPGRTEHPPTLAELGLAAQRPAPADEGTAATARIDDRWWRQFGDPALPALIDLALAGTPDAARRIDVAAEIARAYIGLRAHQALVTNVEESLAAQDATMTIVRFREEARLASALDEARAAAERARTVALLPGLKARLDGDIARLAMLTGQSREALEAMLARAAPIPAGPNDAADPDPAELVARRPDLAEAARAFAEARRRPRRAAMAAAGYKRAVVAALEDARHARVAFIAAQEREADLGRALDAADGAVGLARSQYREGLADFTTLKDAERERLAAADALTTGRADRALAFVALAIAQGAGWSPADAGPPSASPAAPDG